MGDYCQARAIDPVQDTLFDFASNSSLPFGIQSVGGVNNSGVRDSSQELKSLEGGCSFAIGSYELFNQIICLKSFVISPLEGVKIIFQNSVQSALSWFNSFTVTFTACDPIYFSFGYFVWSLSIVGHFYLSLISPVSIFILGFTGVSASYLGSFFFRLL